MTTPSILHAMPVHKSRPAGVAGIAAIFAAASFASAVLALLTWLGRLPLAAGAFLVGGGIEVAGPGLFAMFAAVAAVTSLGLLRLAAWARWLAVGIAAWGMWQAVPGISSAVIDFRMAALGREGAAFIVRGVIVWYLLQAETREAFLVERSRVAGFFSVKRRTTK